MLNVIASALRGQSPTSLLKWVSVIALLLLVTRIVIVSIYRLYFHPLAKYPGPWLAKISDFYVAYQNQMGKLHIKTEKNHRDYGPILRQGPNKLVFNSGDALHGIYYEREKVQKAYGYETMIPAPGAYNIFTATDKEIHRPKRKVLSNAFSDTAIRAFEPTMIHHDEIFVRNILSTPSYSDVGDGWGQPMNMTMRTRHLQYDVMGEFGFGQSFQLQQKTDNHFLIDAVEATIKKAGVYVLYPRLQHLHLEKLFGWRLLKIRDKYLNLMGRLVKERLSAEKDSQHDMFHFLVDAKDPETGKGFTQDELWAESRFLLIAGADTSSTGLAGIFYYLTCNPTVYSKLAHEIRTTFTSGADLHMGEKLSSCHYLRAVIDESLRMSPPISGTLWRETLGPGIELDGNHVPAGIDVGVSPYAVHKNPDLFPEPYKFKPERWIVSESNPKELVERQRWAFSPFSLGTRSCAGRNMAYMEMSDVVARTILYTDFKRADGKLGSVGAGYQGGKDGRERIGEFQMDEHITCHHTGPWLQFRARKGMEGALFGS